MAEYKRKSTDVQFNKDYGIDRLSKLISYNFQLVQNEMSSPEVDKEILS